MPLICSWPTTMPGATPCAAAKRFTSSGLPAKSAIKRCKSACGTRKLAAQALASSSNAGSALLYPLPSRKTALRLKRRIWTDPQSSDGLSYGVQCERMASRSLCDGSISNHRAVWDCLDRARNRHSIMILLHGATLTGAERAAACWAESRGLVQVAFRPDWNRHGKAPPFKRNVPMLYALPVGGDRLSWNRNSGQFRPQGAQDGNSDLGFSEQIKLKPRGAPFWKLASIWFYLSNIVGIYALSRHFHILPRSPGPAAVPLSAAGLVRGRGMPALTRGTQIDWFGNGGRRARIRNADDRHRPRLRAGVRACKKRDQSGRPAS